MIDLSVTIICLDMKQMLRDLLRSIQHHTDGINYEIIVVDNHSSDGTAEMVRTEFPLVRLVENSSNRGVSAARNQAMEIARGNYILLLDADMLLLENSFKKMIEFMNSMTEVGICGCRLISVDHLVQPSGRRFPTVSALVLRRLDFVPLLGQARSLRNHEMTDWDRSDIRPVDYVIGACQMIRRKAMEEVGRLDENIFYGPEDVDYCVRMHRKGWNVYFYPHTSLVHYEQRATKKRPFSRLSWLHLKGIMYLFMKYHGKVSSE